MSDVKREGPASSGKPRLDLPRREEWGLESKRHPGGGASVIVVVLLLAVIGLHVYSLVRDGSRDSAAGDASRPAAVTDLPLRDISARLQRNNLHGAAARVQEELLATLPLEKRDERRRALVTLGSLLVKAERHEEALVRLYEAESLRPDADTQRAIDELVTLCLRKLGKHDELAHELADRTSPGRRPGEGTPAGPGAEEASREVARIGVESITMADLDAMIAEQVDRRLMSIPGLVGEERARYRERLLSEFRAPQTRLQTLQQIVARRVLHREGIERGVDESPAVERELEAYEEELVARQVVLDAIDRRVGVSESDLRNFFNASPGRWTQPARAKARVAILESETKAAEVLGGVRSAEELATAAREHSIDETLRASGGELGAPVVEGQPLPILGNEQALAEAILATAAGRPIERPVEVAGGWAIAFVEEKAPRRTPTFEEARERVTQDYVRAKEIEVQQQLLEELFAKHGATVRTEAFLDISGEQDPDTEKKSGGDGNN